MTVGQEKCLLFLKKYSKDIVNALADSNIFIATAVSQKCLESGFGTSDLAKKYNNFGGIKGKPKFATGKTSNGWAIFKSPYDSFKSYATFINNLEGGTRYAKALSAKTPEEQIYQLVIAGYCVSPTKRDFETGCWRMKGGKCVGKKYVFRNESEYLDARAKDYLSGCKSFINILNEKGIGGKLTSQDVASILKMINETKL